MEEIEISSDDVNGPVKAKALPILAREALEEWRRGDIVSESLDGQDADGLEEAPLGYYISTEPAGDYDGFSDDDYPTKRVLRRNVLASRIRRHLQWT